MYDCIERAYFVAKVPLFAGLPDSLKHRLGEIADDASYRENEVIFEQGEVGDALYIVVEGTVGVFLNGQQIVTLEHGDSFGELALLDDGLRTAGATAQTPVYALRISKHAFEELLDVSPALRMGVLEELARQLRTITEREVILAGESPEQIEPTR